MRIVLIIHAESKHQFTKHAFEGNNVLSLANKITNDAIQPIPSQYSKELFSLI